MSPWGPLTELQPRYPIFMSGHCNSLGDRTTVVFVNRAPSQYPKRRLSVRSRKVSKPRDLYFELSDRSEICQAVRQQCCRCACQISKRYDNLKYRSRGFETLRDLTETRLFGYWDGAQVPAIQMNYNDYLQWTHSIRICGLKYFNQPLLCWPIDLA